MRQIAGRAFRLGGNADVHRYIYDVVDISSSAKRQAAMRQRVIVRNTGATLMRRFAFVELRTVGRGCRRRGSRSRRDRHGRSRRNHRTHLGDARTVRAHDGRARRDRRDRRGGRGQVSVTKIAMPEKAVAISGIIYFRYIGFLEALIYPEQCQESQEESPSVALGISPPQAT